MRHSSNQVWENWPWDFHGSLADPEFRIIALQGCRCKHARIFHAGGHADGYCNFKGCDCQKFTWEKAEWNPREMLLPETLQKMQSSLLLPRPHNQKQRKSNEERDRLNVEALKREQARR